MDFPVTTDHFSPTMGHTTMTEDKERKRRLVAEHGRVYLLWELEAEHNSQTMGVEAVAYEEGLEDNPLPEKVEAYANALDDHIEEERDSGRYEHWHEHVENEHGDTADGYLG